MYCSVCKPEKVCPCGQNVAHRDFNYGTAMVEGGPRIRGIELLRDPHLNKVSFINHTVLDPDPSGMLMEENSNKLSTFRALHFPFVNARF